MKLTSTAFQNQGKIPEQFSANGENISPPLQWQDSPAGVYSFALICEDPDAPQGVFTHWVIYNMPGGTTGLSLAASENHDLPRGTHEGKNSMQKTGYFGPKPPGKKQHHYIFKLFALSRETHLPQGISKEELLSHISPAIVAECQLVGLYGGEKGQTAA